MIKTTEKNHSTKKKLLKKMVNPKGISPIKLDNGLGKTPLTDKLIGSGNGSNLGTNGIF